MKVYIMTDLEGVAGVMNHADWCTHESRYYELGKELLTREVNAAVEGFFAGGADEIAVADGHGPGALRPELLDSRVDLIRGFPGPYPFLLDDSYDVAAWVGQHAKSRTEFAHLAHTGNFGRLEMQLNGTAVGEFGSLAMCAGELGVRVIFLSGDEAGCAEAASLVEGIETAAVKRGTTPGTGDELTAEQYAARNVGAVHKSPERARDAIRAGAERAIRRAASDADLGRVAVSAPFGRVDILRPTKDQPRRAGRASHPSSVIELMNTPLSWDPDEPEG